MFQKCGLKSGAWTAFKSKPDCQRAFSHDRFLEMDLVNSEISVVATML